MLIYLKNPYLSYIKDSKINIFFHKSFPQSSKGFHLLTSSLTSDLLPMIKKSKSSIGDYLTPLLFLLRMSYFFLNWNILLIFSLRVFFIFFLGRMSRISLVSSFSLAAKKLIAFVGIDLAIKESWKYKKSLKFLKEKNRHLKLHKKLFD